MAKKKKSKRDYLSVKEAQLVLAEWAANHNAALYEQERASRRHGGRKPLGLSPDLLRRAMKGVEDRLREQLRAEPKRTAVVAEVAKQYGCSVSLVWQILRAK